MDHNPLKNKFWTIQLWKVKICKGLHLPNLRDVAMLESVQSRFQFSIHFSMRTLRGLQVRATSQEKKCRQMWRKCQKRKKKDYQWLKYSVTKELGLPEGISVRQANSKHMFVLTLLKTSIQMRQVDQTCKEHKLSHEMYNLVTRSHSVWR